MSTLVSVIIPTYNYASFLPECIESVLRQTHQDFEIIVIDDGSTDNTKEVLKDFSDPRIRTLHAINRGVSAARNAGLGLACGTLIAFLDADDRWLPDKLELHVAAFDSDPSIGFLFCNFIRFENDGQFLADQFSFAPEIKNLTKSPISGTEAWLVHDDALIALLSLSDMPWYPSANMVRASIGKTEKFSPQRRIAEDVDYFLRIWCKTRAAFIPKICVEMRRHGNNASATLEFSHNKNMIEILTELQSLPLSSLQKRAVLARIGREWTGLGYKHWQNEEYLPSTVAYINALRFPDRRLNALKHIAALPLAKLIRRRPR